MLVPPKTISASEGASDWHVRKLNKWHRELERHWISEYARPRCVKLLVKQSSSCYQWQALKTSVCANTFANTHVQTHETFEGEFTMKHYQYNRHSGDKKHTEDKHDQKSIQMSEVCSKVPVP